MIWHIAKKEIYHNLTTLRFVLMIILLPILMITNALIYGFGDNGYTAEIRDYNRKVEQGRFHIEKYAAQGFRGVGDGWSSRGPQTSVKL